MVTCMLHLTFQPHYLSQITYSIFSKSSISKIKKTFATYDNIIYENDHFSVHLASLGIGYIFPHKLKHLYVIISASLSVNNISPRKLKYLTNS